MTTDLTRHIDDSLMARLRRVHFELCKSLMRAEEAGMLPDDLEMRAAAVQRDLCGLVAEIEQRVPAGNVVRLPR